MNERPPNKGKQYGICNRTACDDDRAEFFNHGTNAYYCWPCASRINQSCRGESYHPLCYKNTGEKKMKAALALQELAIEVLRKEKDSWEQKQLHLLHTHLKDFVFDEDRNYL